MYVLLWEYRARPEAVERFIDLYGPDGPWTHLFRRAPGYIGTTLLRHATDGAVFLTMDAWASEQHYRAFAAEHATEYDALDRACEEFTVEERKIGSWRTEGAAAPPLGG